MDPFQSAVLAALTAIWEASRLHVNQSVESHALVQSALDDIAAAMAATPAPKGTKAKAAAATDAPAPEVTP